jgi:hypothetical protein
MQNERWPLVEYSCGWTGLSRWKLEFNFGGDWEEEVQDEILEIIDGVSTQGFALGLYKYQ